LSVCVFSSSGSIQFTQNTPKVLNFALRFSPFLRFRGGRGGLAPRGRTGRGGAHGGTGLGHDSGEGEAKRHLQRRLSFVVVVVLFLPVLSVLLLVFL